MTPIDRRALRSAARDELDLELTSGQVDHIEIISRRAARERLDEAQLAYVLATVQHETAGTFRPIDEYGTRARFTRLYDIRGDRPEVAKRLGNTEPGDGARYHGRGYVQLTGRRNYARYGLALDPERATNPEVAAGVLIAGMKHGHFTGAALDDFVDTEVGDLDFAHARRVVNGMDKARKLARLARKWLRIVKAAGYGKAPQKPEAPTPKRRPKRTAAGVASAASAVGPVLGAFSGLDPVVQIILAVGGLAGFTAIVILLWEEVEDLLDRLGGGA